jgi:DNA mismatch repair ATPase MutS
VDLLADDYAAYHFEENIGTDGLSFDHQLRSGPTTSRNAIALLRLQGAPESLVTLALKRAAVLDRQRRPSLARED